ncbi:signal peptide containing protein having a NDK (nucleoside-diphosphate kinase) domain [Cryptosporidium canis]|uniref:Nucleoside diphosphate kinase n=1 Tax=Cryptosporidium canis TaxID=195482 RepID=A0A9D5DIR7_9CRYT|nr:signal peptide containing protein having a NDK (nucleoside-diphosphate kinase) domain [Cryptosporidium canis]
MQKRSIIFALFYLICSILVGYSLSEDIPTPVNATEITQDIENNEDSTNEEEQAQVNATTTETIPPSTNPFTERTLVLLKPEVTHRGLIGEIISHIERKGFKIVAMKFLVASSQQIEAHYSDHAGKPFFESLVSRTSNQPIVAMVLEGLNAISEFRRIMGSTDPKKSDIGTLRAQYGMQTERNLIHASDSVENANLEIFLWFNPDEIYTYDRWVDRYVYYE